MKEQKLKKWIKTIEIDEPSVSFTEEVMATLAVQDDLSMTPALRTALRQHLTEVPSADFTTDIMRSIKTMPSKVSPFVISPKIWYGVGSVILIALGMLWAQSRSIDSIAAPATYWRYMGMDVSALSSVSSILLAVLVALSGLLWIDFWWYRRTSHR